MLRRRALICSFGLTATIKMMFSPVKTLVCSWPRSARIKPRCHSKSGNSIVVCNPLCVGHGRPWYLFSFSRLTPFWIKPLFQRVVSLPIQIHDNQLVVCQCTWLWMQRCTLPIIGWRTLCHFKNSILALSALTTHLTRYLLINNSLYHVRIALRYRDT